jgi:hypothetical protein
VLSTYAAQDSKRLQQTARMLDRDLRPSATYGQVFSASPRLAHTRRAAHATSLLKHSPHACMARPAASMLSTFALQVWEHYSKYQPRRRGCEVDSLVCTLMPTAPNQPM